jgi:uncharacterized protein
MNKLIGLILLILFLGAGGFVLYSFDNGKTSSGDEVGVEESIDEMPAGIPTPHPLEISYMRRQEYPGSDIVIEQTLAAGSNYYRYLASYKSDGLKIFALLTVPFGEPPEGGWPAIIFNHGYIPPAEYRTTESYIAYTDAFSRNGYVLFRPDYRGHGNSEGNPEGAYYSPAYTIDVLNAVSSVKKYEGVNPDNLGMWGHSMGGSITLRNMVVTDDIKAGVIWAGVVASYKDMAENWSRRRPWVPSQRERDTRRPSRQNIADTYGTFEENPEFWESISPIFHVNRLSGPIQLHHATGDSSVPYEFSETLHEEIQNAGEESELFIYQGDDHNISVNFGTAAQRSVEFFDKHLKTP